MHIELVFHTTWRIEQDTASRLLQLPHIFRQLIQFVIQLKSLNIKSRQMSRIHFQINLTGGEKRMLWININHTHWNVLR